MSTKKTLAPATQAIRVQIDVSITLSTKYGAEETRALVERLQRSTESLAVHRDAALARNDHRAARLIEEAIEANMAILNAGGAK